MPSVYRDCGLSTNGVFPGWLGICYDVTMNRPVSLLEFALVVTTAMLLAGLLLSAVFSARTKPGESIHASARMIPVAQSKTHG